MSDEEAFALLATDGMLVKRPIVVTDGAAWWAQRGRLGGPAYIVTDLAEALIEMVIRPARGGWRRWAMVEHARACIAHDIANALLHLRAIAMVLAFVARRFCLHLAASLGANRPPQSDEVGAVWAYGAAAVAVSAGRCWMVPGAVDGDHLRDNEFFTSALAAMRGVSSWGLQAGDARPSA